MPFLERQRFQQMHPKHRILTSSHLDIKASDTTIRFMRTIIQIDDGLHRQRKHRGGRKQNRRPGDLGLLAPLQHKPTYGAPNTKGSHGIAGVPPAFLRPRRPRSQEFLRRLASMAAHTQGFRTERSEGLEPWET
jgi:hypothetical protein